jgi:hypothetical protein
MFGGFLSFVRGPRTESRNRMKSQDIVLLQKLASLQEQEGSGLPESSGGEAGREEASARGLGASLGSQREAHLAADLIRKRLLKR